MIWSLFDLHNVVLLVGLLTTADQHI